MLIIIGMIVVMASVLGGFSMAGGHAHSLVHPSEFVTIGGAALGALIVMSPGKVLKDLIKGVIQSLKGSPFKKKAHEELLKLMYEIFRKARSDGLLGLEYDVSNPDESPLFSKYPLIQKNHHVRDFICGLLGPLVDGSVPADRLNEMAEIQMRVMEEQHHAPLSVLSKTADGLPGFGIVAAVLGIVITMGSIDGPVEEIGHKVGAALVGTFLGILLSYGFLAPLTVNMEFLGAAEMSFFRTIAKLIDGLANNLPPKLAIEIACRGIMAEAKPSDKELTELYRQVETGA